MLSSMPYDRKSTTTAEPIEKVRPNPNVLEISNLENPPRPENCDTVGTTHCQTIFLRREQHNSLTLRCI
jgi:hypothetical protein